MKINYEIGNAAILAELGERIKRGRMDMRLTQKEFAEKAGISTRTLSVAENGGDLRMDSLLRILRVLGYLENLNTLLPEMVINPADYADLGKKRQRVSKKRKPNQDSSGWKWGDEA